MRLSFIAVRPTGDLRQFAMRKLRKSNCSLQLGQTHGITSERVEKCAEVGSGSFRFALLTQTARANLREKLCEQISPQNSLNLQKLQ